MARRSCSWAGGQGGLGGAAVQPAVGAGRKAGAAEQRSRGIVARQHRGGNDRRRLPAAQEAERLQRDAEAAVGGVDQDGDFVGPLRRAAAGGHRRIEADRKSVVSGKSVSVRVDLGGSRTIKKTKQQ